MGQNGWAVHASRPPFALSTLLAAIVLVAGGCSGTAAPSPTLFDGDAGPGNATPAPANSEAPAGAAETFDLAPSSEGANSALPGSSVPAGPATPMPVPVGLVDPCALASLKELSALTGIQIVRATRDANEDGSFVACDFWAADQQDVPELNITLYPYDDSWMDQYNQDVNGGGYQALTGIGDVAEVFVTTAPIESSDGAGKKGNIWFAVSDQGGGNSRPSGQDQAIALLRLVASRLP